VATATAYVFVESTLKNIIGVTNIGTILSKSFGELKYGQGVNWAWENIK
jgi:hypothetical protein